MTDLSVLNESIEGTNGLGPEPSKAERDLNPTFYSARRRFAQIATGLRKKDEPTEGLLPEELWSVRLVESRTWLENLPDAQNDAAYTLEEAA